MNAQMTLSNAERATVRKAITSHPAWNDYRQRHGVTAADMTSSRCLAACAELGIDPAAVLAGEDQETVDVADVTAKPVVTAPKAEKADAGQAIEALRSLLGGGAVDPAQVKAIVEEAIQPLRDQIDTIEAPKPVVRVIVNDEHKGDLPPVRHAMAETLLTCVGAGLNVWLAGPAGSGKTHAAHSIATALCLDWGFHGAMTMAHELTGFVDASGTYHETVFVRLYRNGGVCLLDEVDAGSSEALLALNAALANGEMSIPTGEIIKRHPDFRCIAAANTWGNGATAEYIGRARIDAAFLDRFGARLAWGYDEKLERDLSGNVDWACRVQKARQKAADKGLKILITPRATIAGAQLIAGGMKPDEAAKLTYLAGLTPEQVKMLGD